MQANQAIAAIIEAAAEIFNVAKVWEGPSADARLMLRTLPLKESIRR